MCYEKISDSTMLGMKIVKSICKAVSSVPGDGLSNRHLISFPILSSANNPSCYPSTDSSSTYPWSGGSDIILQIQAVLQGSSRKVHLHR